MSDQREPIFIIGFDRSGTTLLSGMLDSHEDLAIPYESHFIPKYARLAGNYDFGDLESKRKLVREIFSERFPAAWDYKPPIESMDLESCADLADVIDAIFAAYADHKGKRIWGDKTPGYTGQIEVIHSLFPGAKFIHLVRDGRDVALSLMLQHWGPASFLSCVEAWRETVFWARKMGRLLPTGQYMELRYEDLLEDPERQLKGITEFLGLEYSRRMLRDYSAKAMDRVPDDTHAKLVEAPDKSNAYKWVRRLGGVDQHLAFIAGGELLEELGYQPGSTSSNWAARQFRKAYWSGVEFLAWRSKG
jgi:hypothetical protein